MNSKKPVCKYGSSCYRKNSDHLRQFSHPGKDDPNRSRKGKSKEDTPQAEGGVHQKKDGGITAYFDVPSKVKGDSDVQVSSSSDLGSPPSKRLKEDLPQALTSGGKGDLPQALTSGGKGDLPQALTLGDRPPEEEQAGPSEKCVVRDSDELAMESSDVRVNLKRKFLVEMPEDFYQFWDLCKQLNPSHPDAALKSTLGLMLVGPYHVLAGKLKGVPWEQCVLHFRYYYDPPEFQTIMNRVEDDDSGFHIGYFRDDPKSMDCLVVSNCAKNGCEVLIEGDSIFSAVRHQIAGKLNSKQVSSEEKKKLQELDNHLTSYMAERGLVASHLKMKDLWRQRRKVTVTNCFHKIGIVVPYDKKTELGYRPLTMRDRDLNKLLNKIVNCKQDEARRDQAFEPLQEIVTFVQFANDECDYGMGLELGIDLFCHGDQYFHTLIEHLLPVAYGLLQREEYSKICLEHLKQRHLEPNDFSC